MSAKPEQFIPYKVRELKVYSSNEYLAENQRKYRQVYEQTETTYIWAELSFFNKYFDEQDWEFACLYRALDDTGRQLCEIKLEKHISKHDNIFYLREGWGMDQPGGFWKKGTYRWQVLIQDQVVAEKPFYVVNAGTVTPDHNPYLALRSVRLYEAGLADKPPGERSYLKEFNRETTRYIWAEFLADNQRPDDELWPCELFFNFYSDTGELKGQVQELLFVAKGAPEITCSVGWGAEDAGSWFVDEYKLEVVFMDRVIALVPYRVGAEDVEATGTQHLLPGGAGTPPQLPAANLDETLVQLDAMIGLETLKSRVREYIRYLSFLKLRTEKGIEDTRSVNLHAVFVGNPGTGKTTVAQLLGSIYKAMGLLPRGHVHEVDRADLVGEYIGQTAPKVKKAIQQARGGILFIDEAYSLARKNDDSKDFGREVIEILLKELSDGEGSLAIIVAGYPEEMKVFLESNPGLKSRFSQTFFFPDYTPQELIRIADYAADQRKVLLEPPARDFLYKHLVEAYRNRDRSFGNARLVNTWLDQAKMNLGLRVMAHTDPQSLVETDLQTIVLADVARLFDRPGELVADIPIDDALLTLALQELNALVGLEGVKRDIEELVQLVRFYREVGKDMRQEFSLHTIFTGNPGTGKTTVARILANLLKALGILERGHLVEIDRQALVAGYLGQTAEKTQEVLNRAQGGVLFIDEAYTLVHDGHDSFGKEAVATLLKRMEDDRGEFVVVAAGYPTDMERFLTSNPGLKSRFDRTFHFADYEPPQMLAIARKLLAEAELTPTPEAAAHLQAYFTAQHAARDKYFGNGRAVRQVVEKAIKNQHLRLARMASTQRTPELIAQLRLDDVQEFSATEVAPGRGTRIGFRQTPDATEEDALPLAQ